MPSAITERINPFPTFSNRDTIICDLREFVLFKFTFEIEYVIIKITLIDI